MFSHGHRLLFLLIACSVSGSLLADGKIAPQTRDYEIRVDDKPLGNYSIRITHKDEQVLADIAADVQATFFFYTYIYKFRMREIWEQDQITRIDSRTLEDGREITLSALVQGDQASVTYKGQQSRMQTPHFTSSYWHLPPAFLKTLPPDPEKKQDVLVLDPDKGRIFNTSLKFVEEQPFKLTQGERPSSHYRLTGDIDVLLWFDKEGLLLRQKFVEQGHPTDIRLTKISLENFP